MNRKILFIIAGTLIFSISLFLGYLVIDKLLYKKQILNKIQSLPEVPLYDLDSTAFQLSSIHPTVLIYFNTECEHCQYEAVEIKKSIEYFKKESILLISSEGIKKITEFSRKHGLNIYSFVNFAKIKPEDVYETFGSIHAPHVFIYSREGTLVKDFNGEVKVESILKFLP